MNLEKMNNMFIHLFFVHTNIGDNMKALMTGATSGIGYALALKLVKNGDIVYLCVHNDKEIKTVINKLKLDGYQDRVSVIELDITNKRDRDKIKNLDADCLVSFAAVGIGGSLVNMELSDIRDNFEVNFFSTLELIKLYIETRKNKKGRIVVVSSVASLMPISFLGSYSSTKAALSNFVTCLSRELKKSKLDIDIKLVEPGLYRTGFNQVMIDSKNELNSELFTSNMEQISQKQRKLFAFFEYKSLVSIVDKIYNAIKSDSNKLIYRAPLLQVMGLKLYLLLFK